MTSYTEMPPRSLMYKGTAVFLTATKQSLQLHSWWSLAMGLDQWSPHGEVLASSDTSSRVSVCLRGAGCIL